MNKPSYRGVVPEWAEQDAVLLAWPHSASDWAPILEKARRDYCALISAIARYEPVIILSAYGESALPYLPVAIHPRIREIAIPFDDTWVRDYGPISFQAPHDGARSFLFYTFNGWGLKYAAHNDCRVTPTLMSNPHFKSKVVSLRDYRRLALEGVGIECNGAGTALINRYWLTAPCRNDGYSGEELQCLLSESLGVEELISVDVPPLVGDDTDGHIDTIVRFVGEERLAYVSPSDPLSPNFHTLGILEEQLRALSTPAGKPYELIALPDVGRIESSGGEVLPASYANFLLVNDALILPTYGKPALDRKAEEILTRALPEREVCPVEALSLVEWHGSIHCATMQIARGFLAS